MSEVVQKHDVEQSEKIENQNSQNMMIQNNDSNRYSANNHKNTSSYRKTSKRRQAQEEKAAVLDLFKELLKVVNQKFENAYLSPPKPKLSKPPKMLKNQSVKTTKKQQSSKNKKQEPAAPNYPVVNKVQEKSESKEINPANVPLTISNTLQTNNLVPHSSPLVLPLYNSNSQLSSHVRKGSQSHGHREKSLNEKHQLLKETLKKQIFDNYFVSMKYIIHEDFDEEIQESKQIEQQSKMIDESSEHIIHAKFQKGEKNQKDDNYDDFEFMSHEQKMHEEMIKNMKNNNQMDIEWKEMIQKAQNEQNKLLQDQDEESSSSSSEQNQKYPPHSHMPQGHASTTEQFLQQHHPIITTIPLSCQSLPVQQHLESNSPENKQLAKSVSKLPQQKINQEDHK